MMSLRQAIAGFAAFSFLLAAFVVAPTGAVEPRAPLGNATSIIDEDDAGRELSAKSASNGRRAAEQEARGFGMRINWVSRHDACEGIRNSIGCYQSMRGPVMTLSTRLQRYSEQTIRNVVKHEAAHHAIAAICGTTRPISIRGGRFENVTDAFAARYHGMTGKGSYGFNASDTNLARQIHDQKKCAPTQKTITSTISAVEVSFHTNGNSDRISETQLVNRGEKFTYMYRDGDRAFVKDRHGRFGYLPMYAILHKNNYAVETIWNPRHRPKEFHTSRTYTPKYGEKFRIIKSLSDDYFLAMSRDGAGHLLLLNKQNTIKPTVTHQVARGASVYDITNGKLTRCDDCVPAGARTNHITRFDKNYEMVTYLGRSYAVTRQHLRQISFQGQWPTKATPIGHVDKVTVTKNGQLTAAGWAFDRATQRPARVRVIIDHNNAFTANVNRARTDVKSAYPGQLRTEKVGFDWAGPYLTRGKHDVVIQSVSGGVTATIWSGTVTR